MKIFPGPKCNALVATAICSLVGSSLLAQAKDAAATTGDKASWAFGYILVFLLVALGLMAVCRPGNRSSEIKRVEEDDE